MRHSIPLYISEESLKRDNGVIAMDKPISNEQKFDVSYKLIRDVYYSPNAKVIEDKNEIIECYAAELFFSGESIFKINNVRFSDGISRYPIYLIASKKQIN